MNDQAHIDHTLICPVDIRRYTHGAFCEVEDIVIVEHSLTLFVQGVRYVKLLCSPESLEELVLGYLYCEKLIRSRQDVVKLDMDATQTRVDVTLVHSAAVSPDPAELGGVCAVQSGSGKQHARHFARLEEAQPAALLQNVRFCTRDLLEQLESFYGESELHRQTAGVHRSALCGGGKTLCTAQDISRHNAFDKVLGECLLCGTDVRDKYLITSGRVPSDMVMKAVNVGIPMLVSRSAPTDRAVRIAQQHDLTLVGFAKTNRFNVYSGFQRLCDALPGQKNRV